MEIILTPNEKKPDNLGIADGESDANDENLNLKETDNHKIHLDIDERKHGKKHINY